MKRCLLSMHLSFSEYVRQLRPKQWHPQGKITPLFVSIHIQRDKCTGTEKERVSMTPSHEKYLNTATVAFTDLADPMDLGEPVRRPAKGI